MALLQHIVAATVYSLKKRRREFETAVLGTCRLVAEQEPTFKVDAVASNAINTIVCFS